MGYVSVGSTPGEPGRRTVLRGLVAAGSLSLVGGLSAACGAKAPGMVDDSPKARIETSVRAGADDVNPVTPVTVTVSEGKLTSVVLTGADGAMMRGDIAPDASAWKSAQPLVYGAPYTLTAVAVDDAGRESRTVAPFTALTPATLTAAYLVTGEDAVVGIGQPVAVNFDEPVTDRRAAQDAIRVVTQPPVEGAFYWVSQHEVRWRPEQFWRPGTTVDVVVDIFGKDLGGGTYGQENAHSAFRIGDAVISRVDDSSKQVVVERNGEVVRTMPTSMGKASDPTPNGTYIIGDKLATMIMDSSTYGVPVTAPDGYRTPVQYATRMSYSGIFVHAAPWSVWAQGSQNTSHGCLNVSTSDASWFYENSTRGDVVVVSGTAGGTLPGEDGLGDWNIPWPTWKAGNVAG